jgi:tetratricopeptide (TPR) repeat protein
MGSDEFPIEIEDAPPLTNSVSVSEEALATARTLQAMQDQLQQLQQNLDRNRQDADAAAGRSAELLAARLQSLENTLSAQRLQELQTIQSANRWMLMGAGVFALMACVTAVAMAWFQWRTVGKLADIASAIPQGLGVPAVAGALGAGDPATVTVSPPVEVANVRFLGTLDRLEKRILELESFARPALQQTAGENGRSPAHGSNGQSPAGDEADDPGARTRSLVGKGNSLLSLDQYEAALACFEEALQLEPEDAEARLKKGTALEKLGKLEEALEWYDRALAADSSLTVAHLLKGGIYNRLERFAEALVCYEKALQKTEQTSSATG